MPRNAALMGFHPRPAALAITLIALTACEPSLENQIYQSAGTPNITVRRVEGDIPLLGPDRTSIAVYRTSGECAYQFVGTIKVRSEGQSVSLPIGEPLGLRFNFTDAGFIGPGDFGSQFVRVFTATAGHRYELEMITSRRELDYAMYDTTGGQQRLVPLPDIQTVCPNSR